MDSQGPVTRSEAERGRAILLLGILVFRWAALGWMVVLALNAQLTRSGLAWGVIGVVAAWTAWLTFASPRRARPVLVADLLLAVAINVLSFLVVPAEQAAGLAGVAVVSAAAYPIAAAATWGVTLGPRAGLAAGLVLGAALAASRLGVGVRPGRQGLFALLEVSAALNFVVAGGLVGLVAQLLERSAAQLRQANEAAARARERAARLAERESLARQIHDSVLQALALVHKRGRELAAGGPVPATEVARLADMAAQQEQALRALVLREPGDAPQGTASLRASLEALAGAGSAVPVSVSAIGPLWLPIGQVEELTAAVRQALDNVAEHARASRAAVFAEEEDDAVVVVVRDDGIGFRYDEEALMAAGKMGVLKSMKGRVEQLGGGLRIDSQPGGGTEVELRVPKVPGRRP